MRTIYILLFAACTVSAGAYPGKVDEELDNLQGEWSAVSFEANADSVSTVNAGWKVIVKGKRISVRFGAVSFEGNLVLGSAGKQRSLEIVETKWGETPAKTEVSGIYKLERGRLTVCCHFGTQAPPSEFRTLGGAGTMLLVLKQNK